MKILHIEDDENIRIIAKTAFEIVSGFDVCQCHDAPEALELAASFRPDLLLIDVNLPGMTGIEALARLRQIPETAQTPAIFVTAQAQKEKSSEMLESGAIGVVLKPFDPMTLPAQITAFLE